MDPFGVDPGARGLEPALELSSYVADVKRCARRARAPATAAASSPSATPTWACCRSATATAGGAPVQQRGRADRRAAPPARGHRQHGQRSPSISAREPSAEQLRGAEAILIGIQGGERITAEEVARSARHDQLRGHLRAQPARAARLPPRRRAASRRASRVRPRPRARTARATHEPRARGCAGRARGPARLAGRRRGARPRARARRARGETSTWWSTAIPAAAARAMARAAGQAACFALSEEFGAWRVVARDHSWQVDVEPLRGGSLQADLALRDFTVNAIAEPIEGGEPIDPLGGLADLRALGGCAWSAPARSPRTRCASCASCASRSSSSSSADADTLRAARAQAPAARRRLARAGVRGAAPDHRLAARAARRWGCSIELGASAAVLPELEALRGVEQSRFHHLDVHGHTLEVLERTHRARRPRARADAEIATRDRRARAAGRRAARASRSPTSSRAARRCAGARCCTTPPSR